MSAARQKSLYFGQGPFGASTPQPLQQRPPLPDLGALAVIPYFLLRSQLNATNI